MMAKAMKSSFKKLSEYIQFFNNPKHYLPDELYNTFLLLSEINIQKREIFFSNIQKTKLIFFF